MLLFFLRQPEAKALLTFVLSIVILILSANSLLIPVDFWKWLSSNSIYLVLYFIPVIFLMRWSARGGQYTDIHRMDLDGQTFVITGAAGGIGKETAMELAKRGAKVIVLARSTNLAEAIHAVKRVARASANVTGYPIDLADLRSIKNCVEQLMKNENENTKITALINNAGVMACPYATSKDGFELQMGTNHFGHFYLTQLLLPRLQSSRIVNVSSAAHFMWSVPCDASHYAQMCRPNTYHPWSAYSLSKTANILFTRELQQRYARSHQIRAYSLHPGSVNTQINRHVGLHDVLRNILKPIRYVILKNPLEGAQTNLYCALSDQAQPGEYHADCRPTGVFHKYAKDDKLAREWWDYSERVINEKKIQIGLIYYIGEQIPHIVYTHKNDSLALHRVPNDSGREATAYLQFIVDYYSNLPQLIAFVHAHRSSWHQQNPSDIVIVLRALRRNKYAYMPVNSVITTAIFKAATANEQASANYEFWQLFLKDKLGPPSDHGIKTHCCATFAIRREAILAHPKQFYLRIIDYISTSRYSPAITSRIFEYTWHVIFEQPAHISYKTCDIFVCDSQGNISVPFDEKTL